MDAGQQLLDLEGLDDVVIRAHLQAGDLVLDLALGGEHDDGHFHGLAQLAADLPAVHDGQHDIEQHEVGLDLPGHLDGLAAVGRVRDLEPVLLQVQAQQLCDVAIVLHDEHFLAHVMLPPSPARAAPGIIFTIYSYYKTTGGAFSCPICKIRAPTAPARMEKAFTRPEKCCMVICILYFERTARQTHEYLWRTRKSDDLR